MTPGWMEAYFAAFDRTHPPTASQRTAEVIVASYQQRLSLSTLAAKVHMTPRQLTRAFRREYGMSPKQYQRAVRLAQALEQVAVEKVDALALQIGYKSRQNFYRAFGQVTGLTPTLFRKLPNDDALEVAESVRRIVISGDKPRDVAGDQLRRTRKPHCPEARSPMPRR